MLPHVSFTPYAVLWKIPEETVVPLTSSGRMRDWLSLGGGVILGTHIQ